MKKLILACSLYAFLLPGLHAQPQKEFNDAFLKLMTAYPGNFESVSVGPYDSLWEKYRTNIALPGTIAGEVKRKNGTRRRHYETIIRIPDTFSSEQYKMTFSQWADRIASIDLNGAKLTEFKDARYDDKTNWFVSGKAWKIDNAKNNISADYLGFTIRLELLDLDQGGWQLRIVVGDRDIQTGIGF